MTSAQRHGLCPESLPRANAVLHMPTSCSRAYSLDNSGGNVRLCGVAPGLHLPRTLQVPHTRNRVPQSLLVGNPRLHSGTCALRALPLGERDTFKSGWPGEVHNTSNRSHHITTNQLTLTTNLFFREVLKKSPQSVHSKVKTVSTHAHTPLTPRAQRSSGHLPGPSPP